MAGEGVALHLTVTPRMRLAGSLPLTLAQSVCLNANEKHYQLGGSVRVLASVRAYSMPVYYSV